MKTVNRRQMLQIMGVGATALMLGGLAGCTSEFTGLRGGLPPDVSALSIRQTCTRTGKAKEQLNKHLLEEYSTTLKQLIKAARREHENRQHFQDLVKDAQQVDMKIINLYSEAGVWAAADNDWLELLAQDPNAFNSFMPDISQRITSVSSELDFSEKERDEWVNAYSKWTGASFLSALQHNGLETLWRDQVDTVTSQLSSLNAQGQSLFRPRPQCPICGEIALHIFLLVAELLIESECGNCNEVVPPEPAQCPSGTYVPSC